MSLVRSRVNADRSYESIVNSSNTPLSDGQSFVGQGERNFCESVMVTVATDQNGTLYAEFSIDGINWDTPLSFNYRTDRINPPHIFEKAPRYFRVRFTNDSGEDQTYYYNRCTNRVEVDSKIS